MIPFLLRSSLHRVIGAMLFMSVLLSATPVWAQSSDSVLFKDDFNSATLDNRWETPTSWTIQAGAAYLFAGSDRWLRTNKGYDLRSYIIETAAMGFTPGYHRKFHISFGQADASLQHMYMLQYQPDFGGILTLGKSTDNYYHSEKLDEGVLYPNLAVDRWYKFKIARYKSGLIQVYVDRGTGYDSRPFLEAIDSSYLPMGKIGWRVDTETSDEAFFVDWISARKPAFSKPAVREKPVEDALVKQVSAASGRNYTVAKLVKGTRPYSDRDYTITGFPDFMQGASLVQTAMEDKKNNASAFLTSFIKKKAVLYVGYDPRAQALPAWLSTWHKTGERITLTDPGTAYLDVYSKVVSYWQTYPYPVQLGGNMAAPAMGSQMNYIMAAIEVPESNKLEAENAFYQGAQVARNQPGFSGTGFVDYQNKSSDFIEWDAKVTVPGTYTLGVTFSNGSTSGRPLQFSLDGQPLARLDFMPSFSWQSWAFMNGPAVYLKPGVHKIRATAVGASGPNIDYLSMIFQDAGPSGPASLQFMANALTIAPRLNEEADRRSSVQAYPNPFTNLTYLAYSVLQKSKVQLSLFDTQGQLISKLVDEVQQPGTYRIPVSGVQIPSGTYYYKLSSGGNMQVGKLVKQ